MLVKTYRKTGEDRQFAGQKPYSHHNIKQTLITILVVFLLLAAPLAGLHPALSVVYAEAKLQTESELLAGETFPLTVDPGDQTLFLKLPAGLTLTENAAKLAEDGSLVINTRQTLLVKANPGSYTLQLKDSAGQAVGEPLRFTVSAATDSNVDKTAEAANNSEPAVDESGAQSQSNSQEDGSSEVAAGDDNTAPQPGDEAGQAPDGEGVQLPTAGTELATGNTSETPAGDNEAVSATNPEGKDDASGTASAASGTAGTAGTATADSTTPATGTTAPSSTTAPPSTAAPAPTSNGITPLADDQIQSVTVISASTSQIRLGVTISEDYISGGSIELPLNYTPTASSHPYFTYGTNGSNGVGQSSNPTPPFFSAINLISSDQTIVRDYDFSSKPGYLVINLKDKSDSGFSSGYATIVLNLTLNTEWERLIPENTVLWSVAPQAYVDGLPSGTANTQTISGGWPATLSFSMYGSTDPNLNLYYLGGALAPSLHYSPYQLEPDRPSDPNYPINTWIEIPAGSTLGTPSSSQFSLDSAGSSSEFDRYQATTNTPILSVIFTPAASIAVDETFQVRAGISGFRFANGPAEGALQAVPINFTKISPDSSNPQWGLSMSSSASISYCNLADGSVSGSFNFGTRGLTYSTTTGAILNLGWDVITGVSGVVYQRGSGSEKVNINEMHLQFLRESLTTNWCYYQVDYQIIDTRGGSRTQIDPLGVYQPSSATWYEDVQLTLPTLNSYEYIDQIIITPFGAVGNARGVLTGSNGVLASGQITSPNTAIAWDNGLWPDGTAVPEFSMAQLGFVMHYDDNPNKPGGYLPSGGIPSNFEKGITTVYYSDAPFVTARILTSSNDACQIGQTLDCTIEANCGSDCAIDALWIEPRIIISVPKGLNLVSGSGLSGQSSTGANLVIQPQLVSSDSDWNYYSFQVVGANLGRGQSLTIPLSFLVTDTVQGGNYQPTVVLTARDAEVFIQNSFKYNNLNTVYNMNGNPANYGLGSSDRYYVNGTAASYDMVSSLIRILQVPSLSVSTAIKNAWTNDQYVSSAIVPAKPGSDLYVRLSLTNSGNTDLDNIRLYDILPYDNDPLGSSGNMAFVSVTATRGTPQIYYANASNSLPTYGSHGSSGLDLQAASFWDSWSQANLADQTRAVLLDFGQSLTLEAGQTVQIELHFMIPAGDGLHGLNQFYYSAREADDYSVQINIVSPQHGFSTDVIALRYQANLPQLLVSAGSLANLPSDLVCLFNSDPAVDIGSGEKDALLVPTTVPTLAGYQFVGWNTAADGSGQNWSAGSVIQFTRPGGSVNLYAQWQGNLIYINYDLNDSAANPADPFAPLAGSTQAYFGGLIGQSYSPGGDPVDEEPGDADKSSRGGESGDDTGGIEPGSIEPGSGVPGSGELDDQGDDSQGNQSNRAGSSDDNQGEPGTIDPLSLNDVGYELSLAQVVSLSISLLDDGNTVFINPGNPTRSGYIFKGWFESVSLAEAYQPGTAWNFSTSVITNPWGYGSTKTLYAGWEKITVDPPVTYLVSYYSNGSTLGSVPVDNDNPYVSGSLVTVLGRGTLARDDYRFMGWALSASGSVAYQPGARFTITANTAFYAVWQRVESPPIVVTGYSVTYLPGQHGNFAPQTSRGLSAGSPTPAAPQVVAEAGWEFTGWSPERAATVSGNVIYVAQWSINAHTVTFVDWDGTVLKTERVLHGSNATAPAVPVRSGFVFTRWDNDFASITSDLTVQAIHYLDSISQEPREADDGTIVSGERQVPLWGNNDYWALMNLALVVVGIGLALYAVIYKLPVRRRPGDDGLPSQAAGSASGAARGAGGASQGAAGGNARASREAYQSQTEPIQPAWLVTMIILAIAAAVLFILTEDLRKSIALVDFWTIVHALILLLEVIAMAFALRKTEPIDDYLAEA